MVKRLLILLISCCLCVSVEAQKHDDLRQRLDSLAHSSIPALDQEVNISLNALPVSELIRFMSNSIGLNVNIDPSINMTINNNFSKVKAKDVLYFLCTEYKLEMKVYGSIIQLRPEPKPPYVPVVRYDKNGQLLSYDIKDCPLSELTKSITRETEVNFVLLPGVEQLLISAHADRIPLDDAVKQIALSGNFLVQKENERLYTAEPKLSGSGTESGIFRKEKNKSSFVSVDAGGLISLNVENQPIEQLVSGVAEKLNIPLQKLSALQGSKSINLQHASFNTFLNTLFAGTPFTYKQQNGTSFIGNRTLKEIKSCMVMKFACRQVDSLIKVLPKNIFQDVEVSEFPELNSLILIGDADVLSSVMTNLKPLDVSIPVVLIDVMIVDVSKSSDFETNFEAGVGTQPVASQGTINPGANLTLSSSAVNSMLESVHLTKLGKVSPNFYVKLKAMEAEGLIDIRSTPQLSTLNGHPAMMSVGKTEYYQEQTSNIWGTQNPQLQTETIYKPVKAELGIKIKPFVTGNGSVTLDIHVIQSDFTDRIAQYAPPGITSREFKSMIRVNDQEMILLGGLEENNVTKTHSGWPFLTKIPILNWIFSSRADVTKKTKLDVLIKPTVIY